MGFFSTFCDLLRVPKLYQNRLFLRDFSYCAYRCTMPFHHHWQERDFAAEVVIFFFCKGNRRSPQPLSLLGPRPTGIQAASWQVLKYRRTNLTFFLALRLDGHKFPHFLSHFGKKKRLKTSFLDQDSNPRRVG